MKHVYFLLLPVLFAPAISYSQQRSDSTLREANLANCIHYAIDHQPAVQAAKVDEQITETTIKSKLADWYPQLNLDVTLQHYLQLPTSIFPDFNDPTAPKRLVKTGVVNSSTPSVSLTQTIFNRDVLLASRTSRDVRLQARQQTTSTKIDVTAGVATAFYNVLLTRQQIQVLDETIARLDKSLKDAYYQYQAGIVDKTDYKRATIALNNARSDRKAAAELLIARYDYLKQQMGYPANQPLDIQYDTAMMEKDVVLDTTQAIKYETRIEYQQLLTRQRLLQANVKYNQWSYIPTLSAYGNYNLVYQNDQFGSLYNQSFPYSLIGLRLSWPIFQGGKRVQNVRQAELQLKRTEWEMADLTSRLHAEYSQTLANYKSTLTDFYALKENMALAQDVYNTLQLQYKAGVKTYLEVVIAESDLRTTQLNYYNSLYQVLASKIEVEKSLGTLSY